MSTRSQTVDRSVTTAAVTAGMSSSVRKAAKRADFAARGAKRRDRLSGVLLALAAAVVLAGPAARTARAKTALEMLKEQPAPQFRPGHALLPLSRWGWTMPYEVRIELTERWGYALEFGSAGSRTIEQLDDPESVPAKLCALTASDPQKYPLSVIVERPLLNKEFLAGLPDAAWCHDAEGKLIATPRKWLSPEAPEGIFKEAGERAAAPLARIRQKAPIAILLNGGEYGLGVYGFAAPTWQQDPAVVKAKGEASWYDYISARRAHQEMPISDAVRRAVPDRRLYIYYPTSGCPQRGSYDTWWEWTWDYREMKPVSDLPNISIYYKQFNSGFTGSNDMLTQVLNSVGRQIGLGEPLSYNWLCGGWTQPKLGDEAFSDLRRYTGFLKCYYTSGMIGGVAGYFSYPKGGFDGDLGDQMPSWLEQMVILARVQALFSHLDDFLRNGDLVGGPNRHRWSKEQPAYELPTGEADARVLARRHKSRAEWLLTAWAAGGPDREVTVDVPDLGKVTLLARDCGSVYRASFADGRPKLQLVDSDGIRPVQRQAIAGPSPGGSPQIPESPNPRHRGSRRL